MAVKGNPMDIIKRKKRVRPNPVIIKCDVKIMCSYKNYDKIM